MTPNDPPGRRKRALRARSQTQEADLRLGKSGITQGMVNEVKLQLRKKEIIKVKLLKSSLETDDRKSAALSLAQQAGAELVGLTGFIATLYKKNEEHSRAKKRKKLR